jgi:hypothetical protein
MHRTAATLFGFALISGSIWYNATHFPLTWEAASPNQTIESKPSADTSSSKTPKSAVSSEPSQPEAVSSPEFGPAISLSTKPLAPASQPELCQTSSSGTAYAADVRRLPPVDRQLFDRIGQTASSVYGGSNRPYPSTGIP